MPTRAARGALAALAASILLMGCAAGNGRGHTSSCHEGRIPTPGTQFGANGFYSKTDDQLEFTISAWKDLGIRRTRLFVRWTENEPKKGEFQWTYLDRRFAAIRDNGMLPFITLNADGPDWACVDGTRTGHDPETYCRYRNDDDFRVFARAFLERYGGAIHFVQLGNEIDWSFKGTPEAYLTLSNILFEEARRAAPGVLVGLGSVTTEVSTLVGLAEGTVGAGDDFVDWRIDSAGATFDCKGKRIKKASIDVSGIGAMADRVLRDAEYDAVDIHLYQDHANWPKYVEAWRAKLARAGRSAHIVSTEFGGPSHKCEDDTNEELHARRVAEYMNAIRGAGIDEALYFTLVENDASFVGHPRSALFRAGGMLPGAAPERKPGYGVFKACLACAGTCEYATDTSRASGGPEAR